MTKTLIAVDPDHLERINRKLDALLAIVQPPREWLTMDEAVAATGLSASTIRRRAKTGEIEVSGVGKSRRFRIKAF